MPKAFGDEDQSAMKLIGANNIPVTKNEIQFNEIQKKIDYYEIDSPIIPYVDEDEFWKLKNRKYSKKSRFIKTDEGFKIDFSGKYDTNLLQEIHNYAAVSELIANNTDFDIIHAHDWLAYPA